MRITPSGYNLPDPRWPVPQSLLDSLWLDSDKGSKAGVSRFDTRCEPDCDLDKDLEETFPSPDRVSVFQMTRSSARAEFR